MAIRFASFIQRIVEDDASLPWSLALRFPGLEDVSSAWFALRRSIGRQFDRDGRERPAYHLRHSISLITEKYGAAAQTIIGCCDTQVFMGINDMQTAQELSLRTNKPLFEIGSLPLGQEIVFIRGERPMQVRLYDANNHPAIKWAKGRCSSRTIANSCARRIKTDVIDRCRKGDNAWTA